VGSKVDDWRHNLGNMAAYAAVDALDEMERKEQAKEQEKEQEVLVRVLSDIRLLNVDRLTKVFTRVLDLREDLALREDRKKTTAQWDEEAVQSTTEPSTEQSIPQSIAWDGGDRAREWLGSIAKSLLATSATLYTADGGLQGVKTAASRMRGEMPGYLGGSKDTEIALAKAKEAVDMINVEEAVNAQQQAQAILDKPLEDDDRYEEASAHAFECVNKLRGLIRDAVSAIEKAQLESQVEEAESCRLTLCEWQELKTRYDSLPAAPSSH
jgi:hypothetical protein